MPRLAAALLTLFLLLFAAAPVGAASWQLDNDHSRVLFTVRHIAGEVSGSFNAFSGRVEFDPEHPESGRLDIQVIVSSIDTGVARRDQELLGPDFFDAGPHPTIRFVSEGIVDKGGGAFEARGHLTMKDVSRSVALPFEIIGVARSPLKDQACTEVMGVRGRLSVNRLEYNVGDGTYFDMGLVGDEVALTVRAELLRRLPDCTQ